MEIFVHVPIFEGIMGRFLGGVDGCIEVLQLGCKAHADFERICHDGSLDDLYVLLSQSHTSIWLME